MSACFRTTYRKINLERCPFGANTYIHVHLASDIAGEALLLLAFVLALINHLALVLVNALEVVSYHSLVRHLLRGDSFVVASLRIHLGLELDRVVVLDNARVLNWRNIATVMKGFHLGNDSCVLGEAIATEVNMAI